MGLTKISAIVLCACLIRNLKNKKQRNKKEKKKQKKVKNKTKQKQKPPKQNKEKASCLGFSKTILSYFTHLYIRKW